MNIRGIAKVVCVTVFTVSKNMNILKARERCKWHVCVCLIVSFIIFYCVFISVFFNIIISILSARLLIHQIPLEYAWNMEKKRNANHHFVANNVWIAWLDIVRL